MRFLLILAFIGSAFVLLSVRILFKKNGRFSSQHIGENAKMREKGIHCAISQDAELREMQNRKINVRELS